MINGDIKLIKGTAVAPATDDTTPILGIKLAIAHVPRLKNRVQNTFYLVDIPSCLYKSSSIVFLQGSIQIGMFEITEIIINNLAICIQLED